MKSLSLSLWCFLSYYVVSHKTMKKLPKDKYILLSAFFFLIKGFEANIEYFSSVVTQKENCAVSNPGSHFSLLSIHKMQSIERFPDPWIWIQEENNPQAIYYPYLHNQ